VPKKQHEAFSMHNYELIWAAQTPSFTPYKQQKTVNIIIEHDGRYTLVSSILWWQSWKGFYQQQMLLSTTPIQTIVISSNEWHLLVTFGNNILEILFGSLWREMVTNICFQRQLAGLLATTHGNLCIWNRL